MGTVIILNIGTDRSEQTVQTQIRLLLMEQSDQGLLCLSFCLHLLTQYCSVKSNCSNCTTIMVIISGVPIFRIFTVHHIFVYDIKVRFLFFIFRPLQSVIAKTTSTTMHSFCRKYDFAILQ